MESRPVTREELVQLYDLGVTRKKEEHEVFVLRGTLNPDRANLYSELQRYVDFDVRYSDMAKHYYAEDLAYFENGLNDDLLYMTEESELSPKLYAEYLREIDPAQRNYEKITHGYLMTLKKNIAKVKERMG